MKRIAILVLLTLMWSISSASTELKVGEKAADFILKDSLGKEYTLNSTEFYGRVVYINYSDISSKDMNKHVDTSLKEDTGIDRKSNYVGFGIANMKASIVPDFIIARVIKSKQQETGATILLDENYTIMNLWGLKNHSSNVVVLDKNRICRYIYKGKLPTEEVAKLIKIIKEYQVK
ncbi:MAG TPA: YtfJ family protein [Syntrophales bacterium]|nr:YtfJ family protein [Syntrophales bacterium]